MCTGDIGARIVRRRGFQLLLQLQLLLLPAAAAIAAIAAIAAGVSC